ncbi:MAG TPA: hypothetical protein VF519_07035 [Mycobacteriales bacterium]|jgi:DNA-directed RNA polymerase specialized sigma24 family protein
MTSPPDDYGDRLAAAWPEVQTRLTRTLERRGACPDVARDIAQEVALRTFDRRVTFVDTEDLLRWCNVAGSRLLVDHHRSRRRWAPPPGEEVAAAWEPGDLVALRLEAAAVVAAVRLLSPSDRAALTGRETACRGDRTASNRLAARRSRARARLRRIVE